MKTASEKDEYIRQIIQHFDLRELPGEGGLFAQTYRSAGSFPDERPHATAILYLLTAGPGGFSALHRLRGDEIYHFYLGDPVEMLLLLPDGSSRRATLGQNVLSGQMVQLVVPGGVWQGARLPEGGRFALLGTTMTPGWDERDFELGKREELVRAWPGERERIEGLVRGEKGRQE